ncbi:MAG TPA: hypothetical protein VMT80_00205 [Candidatus Paceibacterota bacterium]|nr:hypothetical protein [Candidatus Paceibacterota bacterium]
MIRGLFVILTLASVAVFPWPVPAVLALSVAVYEPLVPLAAGLFADTLYYAPHAAFIPYFTLAGLLVSVASYLVRRRLRAGIIGE